MPRGFGKTAKSLQSAQDLANIFQRIGASQERYRLEIEEGAQEQVELKRIWGGIAVCPRFAGNH